MMEGTVNDALTGNIYDISMPITVDMPVYKNRPEKRPEFRPTATHEEKGMQETRIHLDVHCGTHIDAPLHMVAGGATIETIELRQLVRDCRVVDLTHVKDRIHKEHLVPLEIRPHEFLLVKTANSRDTTFNPEFVFLAEDGAKYLADIGIDGIGIDALGIERSQPEHSTHKALFATGAIIMEGLRLADVPAGAYQMTALPLALIGLDAAPARVILTERS